MCCDYLLKILGVPSSTWGAFQKVSALILLSLIMCSYFITNYQNETRDEDERHTPDNGYCDQTENSTLTTNPVIIKFNPMAVILLFAISNFFHLHIIVMHSFVNNFNFLRIFSLILYSWENSGVKIFFNLCRVNPM